MARRLPVTRENLIQPLFVHAGSEERREIASMPGQYQFSISRLAREVEELGERGVTAVILFGLPAKKDAAGSDAYAKDGVIQQAVRAVKDRAPGAYVITDLCLCEYTDHGHCGLIGRASVVDNDATLPLIERIAVTQVEAGADMVAPSGMMVGGVRTIRRALPDAPILAYSAKYASAFYGPFREAADSSPKFGDRSSYQLAPSDAEGGLRRIASDIADGADVVMVKPALAYLDVLRRARESFKHPLAAYNVSGEYAMAKASGPDERRVALEMLTAIRRAGADLILTYWAKEAVAWLS